MRLAHKRKVQMKLQKRIQAAVANIQAPKKVKPVAEKKAVVTSAVEKVVVASAPVAAAATSVSLTPKQQQVLDIIVANAEGINPKGIGLMAGQEESKAASWATGALKKLLEENLVVKEQLAGNKVRYKIR